MPLHRQGGAAARAAGGRKEAVRETRQAPEHQALCISGWIKPESNRTLLVDA